MNIKKVYFKTGDGVELFGLLHEPEKLTKEIFISIHGMGSNCFKRRETIFAEEVVNAGKAYFCFNNRGTEYMVKFNQNDERLISGTTFEEILDSHHDISAAIEEVKKLGYEKINLIGHSLGCTKIVYWYNKVNINNQYGISSINLLSLVDIVGCQKEYLKDKYDEVLQYAQKKQDEEKENQLMPEESFFNPISVKSYLRYFKYNEKINFARYADSSYEFNELNNIKVPLFIRWGNVRELIIQTVNEVINILNDKIKNPNLNLGYIDGADHSFSGKEKEVIKQILEFRAC